MDQVGSVLDEYREHLPLTIRQVYYRLVHEHGYENSKPAYECLARSLKALFKDGHIDFGDVDDGDGESYGIHGFPHLARFWRNVRKEAANYRLDRQTGQPRRIWLVCEAQGLAPTLARVVQDYGVPVLSGASFHSWIAQVPLALQIQHYGMPATILHVGDYDARGRQLLDTMVHDLPGIVGNPLGEEIEFARLAVTPSQIFKLSLSPAPPETYDAKVFLGRRIVQAAAMPPDVLAQIARQAVEDRQDAKVRDELLSREADVKRALLVKLDELQD
jgi:hypothetical protein